VNISRTLDDLTNKPDIQMDLRFHLNQQSIIQQILITSIIIQT